MVTSFITLFLLLTTRAHCENDYHNLLHRYHELMNDELLDESHPSFHRESNEGTSSPPDSSSFHSHHSQPPSGVHGGDMRLPLSLLSRLVSEGERRKAMRLSNGELRL